MAENWQKVGRMFHFTDVIMVVCKNVRIRTGNHLLFVEIYTKKEVPKVEKSEFQIMRWGIPGWVTILTYLVLDISVYGYDISTIISENNIDGVFLGGLAALLAAIGIPLGYIIYQVYFFIKWKFFMNGRDIDKIMEGVKFYEGLFKNYEFDSLDSWRKAERVYGIMLSIILPLTKVSKDAIFMRHESFKSRTDRVHGLGSSLLGMIIAMLLIVIPNLLVQDTRIFCQGSFIVTLFILLIVLRIFLGNYRVANKDSFRQMGHIMKDIQVAYDDEYEKSKK